MKKYVVIAKKATFSTGAVLALTADQARARLHNLQKIDSGTYRVVHKVEFKFGEEIGFDGEINKALLSVLAKEGSAEAQSAKSGVKNPAAGTEDVTADDILAAVQSLDPVNEEHWNKDGTPSVKAVSAILQARVSKGAIEAAAPHITRESPQDNNGADDETENDDDGAPGLLA